MSTFTFNPTGTVSRFAEFIAENHSESCIAAKRATLLSSVSDAFSQFARANDRSGIYDVLKTIKDKDVGGLLIKHGIDSAFDAFPTGFKPDAKKGLKSFKTLTTEQQTPYITGHGLMMQAFESAIVNYGVKVELSDEEKAKRKIEKQARAEKKLNDSIKALGLVDPATVRPLDNSTVIGIVVDLCRAGDMALVDLQSLAHEVNAALTIAQTAHELAQANMRAKNTAKVKADKKAKEEKIALSKEAQYVQAAVASATA